MKRLSLYILCFGIVFGQEPSAFNAGAIAPKKTEQEVTQEKLFNLSSQMKSVNESQEGLKSVFEGQMQRIQELSNRINAVSLENNATSAEIKSNMDSNFEIQNKNIESLKQSIAELGKLLQENNNNLKKEIASLQKQINEALDKDDNLLSPNDAPKDPKSATQVAESNNTNTSEIMPKVATKEENKEKSAKTDDKPKKVDLKSKSLAEVFKEGEGYLSKKEYSLADEYLQFAVKGNYKPARGNFLLGEIAFAQKKYEDAIYYYKTSATRYDKADYMPTLMLNSAKSFRAINETENSNKFLKTLIQLYPDSKEAVEAKKLL